MKRQKPEVRSRELGVGTKLWTVFLCAVLLQPWGAYQLMAADIVPGYTFTSGEKNITHTKLNNAAAGTIATSFYSGKSSAGTDPNSAFELLLRDTSLDIFKRTTLAEAVFNHSGLLSTRSAKTVPVGGDGLFIMDSAAGNAYKQMTLTNAIFAGAATPGGPTNETKVPTLWAGALGTLTLSNMIGGAANHALPTNGDLVSVLTSNGGRAYKSMRLEDALVKGYPVDPQHYGSNSTLVWGPNGLRQVRFTNLIDSLTLAAPTTNAVLDFLEPATTLMSKMTVQGLMRIVSAVNIVQSAYTGTTNFSFSGASGTWSNVTTIGTSSLSNAITPRFTTSKILVRVVLTASATGGGDNGYMQVLRNGTPIGVGDSDGASRVEAGTSILNSADAGAVVWEWLDSPATTSAVGYNVQVSGVSGSPVYINRDSSDGNSTSNGRYVSTLTLTEVLQ